MSQRALGSGDEELRAAAGVKDSNSPQKPWNGAGVRLPRVTAARASGDELAAYQMLVSSKARSTAAQLEALNQIAEVPSFALTWSGGQRYHPRGAPLKLVNKAPSLKQSALPEITSPAAPAKVSPLSVAPALPPAPVGGGEVGSCDDSDDDSPLFASARTGAAEAYASQSPPPPGTKATADALALVLASSRTADLAFDSINCEQWKDDASVAKRLKDLALSWVARCEAGAGQFRSVTLACEWMLAQTVSSTAELGLPNPIRTAMALLLLYRCLPASGRGRTVMQSLFHEVLVSIYDLPPDCLSAEQPNLAVWLTGQTYFEKAHILAHQYQRVDKDCRHFATLWSTKHRFINLHNITTSRLRVLHTFNAWRKTVIRGKIVRKALEHFTARFTRKDLLQTTLYAWRLYSSQHRAMRESRVLRENMAGLTSAAAMRNELMRNYEQSMEEVKYRLGNCRDEADRLRLETAHSGALLSRYDERLTRWKELAGNMYAYFTDLVTAYRSPLPEKLYKQYGGHAEMAEKILLDWINETIRPVAPEHVDPVSNFSSDLNDGSIYIYLLHAVTNRDFGLDILDYDFELRAEAVLSKCRELLVYMPSIAFWDINQGTADLNMALVFFLWCRFGRPTALTVDRNFLKRKEEPFGNPSIATETTSHDQAWMKLNDDYHKAGDDLAAWLIKRRILTEYITMLLVQRAQGQVPLLKSSEPRRDDGGDKDGSDAFSAVKLKRIRDLLEGALAADKSTAHRGALQDVRLEQSLNQLKQVLRRFDSYLRSVFRTYTGCKLSMPLHKAQLEFSKFIRFCTDSKLLSGQVTKQALVKVYSRSKRAPEQAGSSEEPDEAAEEEQGNLFHSSLSPSEWVEFLIRFSVNKYNNVKGKKPAFQVHNCVEQLIEKDLIPHLVGSDNSEFKAMVWSETIQAVIKLYRSMMSKLFKPFAKKHSGSDVPSLNLDGFHAVWKECGLMDGAISTQTYTEIFETLANQKGLMIYSVFEHSLVAVAAYRYPSPFQPMHHRLRMFMEKCIGPAIQHSKLLRK